MCRGEVVPKAVERDNWETKGEYWTKNKTGNGRGNWHIPGLINFACCFHEYRAAIGRLRMSSDPIIVLLDITDISCEPIIYCFVLNLRCALYFFLFYEENFE